MRRLGEDPLREARRRMVRRHLAGRGIHDRRVLAAIAAVPREQFVPDRFVPRAYEDTPLPTESGQTISQPYIVGIMTLEARLTHRSRVLEVGTGTGYHTAILARLARHVWTIERIASLSRGAQARLAALGIANVTLVVGDGALGYPPAAPYDAILVAAATPKIPPALLRQLAPGGRLVAPVGDRSIQELVVYERTGTGQRVHDAGPCRFVPLISPAAFTE